MTPSLPAPQKRRLIEVQPGWLTPAGQRKRAKRIARAAEGQLRATVGEMAIARQMGRNERDRVGAE